MTTVSSFSGFSAQQLSQNNSARLQAAIARLVGLPGIFPAVDSVAGLSTAVRLQAQNSDIRQISSNIAGALSLSQVAEADTAQVDAALQQLRSLAQQAQSPTLNDTNRAQLDVQFQQLLAQIDAIAQDSNFNDQKLLDGSLSGEGAISIERVVTGGQKEGDENNDLSIPDLRTSALFNGQELDIRSAGNATEAFNALASAIDTVAVVRNDVAVFQQVLEFTSANVDTALANQLASLSVLQESDLIAPPSLDVQQNAANAVAAQASRLSPTLLQLIS